MGNYIGRDELEDINYEVVILSRRAHVAGIVDNALSPAREDLNKDGTMGRCRIWSDAFTLYADHTDVYD